jgi:hypothetical protein
MKKHEKPIPLRSVVGLPRWMMLSGVSVGAACLLAGCALLVYMFAATPTTSPGNWYGGLLGGAIGCFGGGAGALFGTLRDWHRRMPAPLLFAHLQQDRPSQFYRRTFWPALAVAVVATAIGCAFGHWRILSGFLQTGWLLAFLSGSFEAVRRHTTKQARAVFALYADGLLEESDAEAIDDARRKDPAFDAAVQDYQQVAAQLRRLGADAER